MFGKLHFGNNPKGVDDFLDEVFGEDGTIGKKNYFLRKCMKTFHYHTF